MTSVSLTPRAAREQQTFRALLNAMARPGSVGSLNALEPGTWFAPLVAVAEALVDHEVSFAVVPDRPDLTDAVLRQTGSHLAELKYADYVLCDQGSLPAALEQAKEGILEYPDRGATIVCLVESVSATPAAGTELVLSGPGILYRTSVWVDGFGPEAAEAFSRRNDSPPLGIDLVLVSPAGSFTCLTRYTSLVKEAI